MTEQNRLASPSDTGRLIYRPNRRNAGWRIMSVSGDGQTVFCIPVQEVGKEFRRVPAGEPRVLRADQINWSTMTWPAEPQEMAE